MYFLLVISIGLLILTGVHFIIRDLIIENGYSQKYDIVEIAASVIITIALLISLYFSPKETLTSAKYHYLQILSQLIWLVYLGLQVMTALCYTRKDQRCRHYLLSVAAFTLSLIVMVVWWFMHY